MDRKELVSRKWVDRKRRSFMKAHWKEW